eukprot:TRINITY_DN7420_c0_g1_i1.p2 TRINITY_DN7420_c0_g1~~TRINITY_DN7420_c0_g1_i1.p2  ORF type:complete len:312 (+),score=112.20 TRINITY_DN7420_c0_g1_i1:122-1057(+)
MAQGGPPAEFGKLYEVKELGKGSFGTVYLCLTREGTGKATFMAVKRTVVQKDAEADSQIKDFVKEVDVMKQCKHPNIVGYLGSSFTENDREFELNIFLEYVTGGSATHLIKMLRTDRQAKGGWPDERVNGIPIECLRIWTRHIVQGLHHLHSQRIAHRDIKGDNVLISHDTGVAKLADFGAAHASMKKTMTARAQGAGGKGAAQTFIGTPYWMAPEVITSESGYDPFKADIWSLGCTIGEMWTGSSPWKPQKQMMTVLHLIAQAKGWPDNIVKELAVKEEGMEAFFSACFSRNPGERKTTGDLLKSPFCKE